MPFTLEEEQDLPQIISAPRFATYLLEKCNDVPAALELYQWNLEISAALVVPLQICEVAVRNGVIKALEKQYGEDWHTSPGFHRSLPSPGYGYNSRSDLTGTISKLQRNNILTAGKVVAELKFVFWEMMLTARHDERLWKPCFADTFPHADVNATIHVARGEARVMIEKVRTLRNRIAHHEPIIFRNIDEDYNRIIKLIRWRSPVSADWVDKIQTVTAINARRP